MKKSKKPSSYVRVAHDRYHIRQNPNACSISLGRAKAGDLLPYLGESNHGWLKVKFGKKVGYIHVQGGMIVEVEKAYVTVKKGKWHVRTAPKITADSMGTVSEGMELIDRETVKGNFHAVEFNGKEGWLSSRAIEKEGK